MADGTKFSAIYNRFLGKITDDMYMELTPEDTIKDLQSLLMDAIPGFEFPRQDLYDYEVKTEVVREDTVSEGDFIIGVIWNEIPEDEGLQVPDVIVEKSAFAAELTAEEQNILALLMKQGWVQRQVASIEQTRMKYSGSDFKFTSQANHLSKLLTLLEEAQRESFHMQRLYKRRKYTKGLYLRRTVLLISKYGIEFDREDIIKNAQRLTNQLWKLIPMREHEENWQKQLDTVILEIVGFNEIFIGASFLQMLCKLEGLKVQDTEFDFYRKTVFECISLLQEFSHGDER